MEMRCPHCGRSCAHCSPNLNSRFRPDGCQLAVCLHCAGITFVRDDNIRAVSLDWVRASMKPETYRVVLKAQWLAREFQRAQKHQN